MQPLNPEDEFGRRVARLLDSGLAVPADVEQRLGVARQHALARATSSARTCVQRIDPFVSARACAQAGESDLLCAGNDASSSERVPTR